MAPSKALGRFNENADSAEALLKLEVNQFPEDPPLPEHRVVVEGLRGGAAVLLVGGFEAFLRSAVREHLAPLSVSPLPVPLEELPKKLRLKSVFGSLDVAMKAPPESRLDRISNIRGVLIAIENGTIDLRGPSDTGGNPNSKRVVNLFNDIGCGNIFGVIRKDFEKAWRRREIAEFIPQTLDTIVNRRHVVAHTANALDISRKDLQDSLNFMRMLTGVLDEHLQQHATRLCTPRT